ncbi:hypothetical protein BEP19_08335 [Ammoniphilus oxalaticus]|uniref:Uncharacterized protein n=1 Tax=Ammoniphilus oxalaticus TaxID=66863 RepID=A0A419SKB2_9BACL|nr:hypothetical protein [Ammoniphilus oxalaticus]RKD24390.1 hypothetical protein BEP19_08335 [Ammoniphilus oxalaticus]
MGIVDLSVLSWGLFWTGVVSLLLIGGFFSFGVLLLAQNKRKKAIFPLVLSGIGFFAFLGFASTL